MAEPTAFSLTHKEVTEALIKYQNLHQGIWQLYVEFGITAANIQTGEQEVSPSAIVPIRRIGLTKVDAEGPIALDASKVNPE